MTTTPLSTERLDLEPLTAAHADEMVAVLADPGLYAVTGGRPPTLDALREQYRRQSAGSSPDGTETWHTWILRLRATGEAVGYVQATVRGRSAELAWVVGAPFQGRGCAQEAAAAVRDAVLAEGADEVSACIAPGHSPSESVARRIGLRPTDEVVDGEIRWTSAAPPDVSMSRDRE